MKLSTLHKPLSVLLLLGGFAGCSEDNDSENASFDTPNAQRCEILDADNCMFPWPSSAFTVADASTATGRRVNLNQDSMPANKQGVHVDPTEWNRNDGFSPSQMILAQIPGLDLERSAIPPITDLTRSLQADSPLVVINADSGEQHLVYGELDVNAPDAAEQAFIIRPMVQFERGARYIVALRQLRNSAGDLLAAPDVFRAFRDNVPTGNPAIEDRRASMESMFDTLEDAGIGRDDLYLAWDFNIASVENITERLLHIRDDAFASLGATAPAYSITEVIDFAPCSEDCAEGEDEQIAREVSGTFVVPNYLDSDDGGPGSSFFYAAPDDGLPDRIGGNNTLEARFICRIPRSVAEDFDAAPKAVARPSLYGHGLLGSAGEVQGGTRNNVDIMANDHQMMFCATDWIGFAGEDVGAAIAALQDWSLLKPVFDRQQQGFLNFMYLGRLLKHSSGFVSNSVFQAGGAPVFDNSTVYYDGNSQGGILGGALMAVTQDITRGVLGVPGMAYSFLLRRSSDFEAYKPFFSGSGTGDSGGGYPSVKDQSFLLSQAQMLWDRAEASGYSYHITDNLLPNTPRHSVLLHVAYGDFQVSMWTAEAMARTIGAALRMPALQPGRHPDTNPFVDMPTVPAGQYTGSALVYWDGGPVGATDEGTAPPPTDNSAPFEPDYGEDPHSLPRRESAAQLQKSLFLRPDGVGEFVDTCTINQPCTTNGYVID
jgi:hypothetical protein